MDKAVREKIEQQVKGNKVFIYMKGSPQFPQCGFSARACQILNTLGTPYRHCDVLGNPDIREGVKEFSNWPTLPQVYIDGKFVGGSDILSELHERGELKKLAGVAP